MRNRTATLLAFFLLLFTTGMVCALEETIVLGGESGWGAGAVLDGLMPNSRPGELALMPQRYEPDAHTEFLLHFDSTPLVDSAGNFQVVAADPEISNSTRRSGTAALLIDNPSDVVSLVPVQSSLFRSGVEWSGFSLEFWLYPVAASDGERILEWTGREGPDLDFRSQQILVSVRDRRLNFSFSNFFTPPDRSEYSVELTGNAGLIPRRWSHHRVEFDATAGRLEYFVDGLAADVTYVSETGRQDGTVFYPRTATYPGDSIRVAPLFTGVLDELRLVSESSPDPDLSWYPQSGGAFESGLIDLGSPGAVLTGISVRDRTPGMSDVFVYARVANTQVAGTAVPGEWVPIDLDSPFPAQRGRFVQVRVELYPDPAIRDSPILSRVALSYLPDSPPYPPFGLRAVPGDGRVDLSWSPVLQEDIQGYLVYYGTQPGRYGGSGADPGPSPIDIGQATAITVSGLNNGTLYYFAVSAYDAAGTHSATELSAEVAARPARVYQ